MLARAWRPARTGPLPHELPAAHDTHAPPAAAHHPALHPLPAQPGRVLGQPQRRPDGAPPLVPVLLPGPRLCLPSRHTVRQLEQREDRHAAAPRRPPTSARHSPATVTPGPEIPSGPAQRTGLRRRPAAAGSWPGPGLAGSRTAGWLRAGLAVRRVPGTGVGAEHVGQRGPHGQDQDRQAGHDSGDGHGARAVPACAIR